MRRMKRFLVEAREDDRPRRGPRVWNFSKCQVRWVGRADVAVAKQDGSVVCKIEFPVVI